MSNGRTETSNAESHDIYIAKLAVAGAAVTMLGDSLALLAASLTLESLQHSTPDSSSPPQQRTEEQIDYLIHELKQIKKMLKKYKM